MILLNKIRLLIADPAKLTCARGYHDFKSSEVPDSLTACGRALFENRCQRCGYNYKYLRLTALPHADKLDA
jgi:hypothetical protein